MDAWRPPAADPVAALLAREATLGGPLGREPVRLVRAPGRVNLIGEHTDYNDGLVLPAAIDLEVRLAFRPHAGHWVELTSLELGESARFELDALAPDRARPRSWIDYAAGTAWALGAGGWPTRGFRGVVASTIPVGAGLSSSAALEMAAALALLPDEGEGPTVAQLAAAGRRCENEWLGVASGIMDQTACLAGRAGRAVLLDCRTVEYRHVPLPADLAIVVCHTGSERRLDGSAFNERVGDCATAVRLLAEREPGVRALRDVDAAMLERHRADLPERVWRRCAHVVAENDRVLEAAASLHRGDTDALGPLFAASHASLRDLYEVSSPELDALVEVASAVPGVVAARMTGAGFGGCTVNLVRREAVERFVALVPPRYHARTGLEARVFVTRAVDGARRLPP